MVHLLIHWVYINKISAGEQIVKHVENLKENALHLREKAIRPLERDLARLKTEKRKKLRQEKIKELKEQQDRVRGTQEAIDEFVEKQYATPIKLF